MRPGSPLAKLGALWGVFGVLGLFGMAVDRLAPNARIALGMPLTGLQWAGLAASVVFLGYFQGYKAFQRGFSPRVVARARYLVQQPSIPRLIFAPLFCVGFFHATRRRKIAAYAVTAAMIGLVILVHWLAQPWRGIVDLGVALALVWGMIVILAYAIRAAGGQIPPVPADLPESGRSGFDLARPAAEEDCPRP